MKSSSRACCVFTVILILGIGGLCFAEELHFEGQISDSEGSVAGPVVYQFEFVLYESASDGHPLWSEFLPEVEVVDGQYSLTIGGSNPINLAPGTYWLETIVDGEPMSPRAKVRVPTADCTITGDVYADNAYVDQRIGVNTSSPNDLIEIVGSESTSGLRVRWGGTTYPNLYGEFQQGGSSGLIINSNAGGGWADIRFQTDGTDRMFLERAGNFGIGTTAPGAKLEVVGNARFGDWDQPAGVQGGKVQIHNASGTGNSLLVTSYAFGTVPVFVVDGDGDVGFGTASPSHPIHHVDGAYCTGSTWVNGSSRELKDNIRDIDEAEAREVLDNLEPVSFNYKSDLEELNLGFIAEDVPELVATKDRKGLSAMDIVAVLTKVMQAQQQQIDDLTEEIEKLKAGNSGNGADQRSE